MVGQARVADRYELKDVLGEGGMGVVFRAYDIKTKSMVALKTMRDVSDPLAVELFSKEWTVLASISHPNIVDIRDVGEIDENGRKKPFFVMPLLPGTTLAKLIETSSSRLTVERVVGIMAQVCRGLQAAHERGLIHRDIKPSNIFVMEDDTAKIIDFGVAHLAGSHSVTGQKGTWQYMAPEQIDLKPITPVSDVFSLGVVCYETLTNRKPFACKTPEETAEAVRERIAPPIFEINPGVSPAVSSVIHKAMAKQPLHRLSSAREFAELLQKAHRNELTERFDRSKIQPRIERAKKALAEADADFASEILTALETEGYIDPEISLLRNKIDQTVRQRKIRQLLETARTRVEQDEIPLALEKLLEVLEIDPENADALALRSSIEQQRNDRQIESWMALARRHLDRHDFPEARQALTEVLKIRPSDSVARGLLQEAERREQEALRTRAEIEQLYGSAVNAYHSGEISTALTKLERLLEIGRQVPDAAHPDRDALYRSLYKEVRSEHDSIHNAYEDARRQLAERNFGRALEICEEFLGRYPTDPVFQALKLEAVELRRQELSEYIAEVGRRADAESDLDRKLNIFKEACERYPNEQQFQQSLKLTRERRDLVLSIVAKARNYEDKNLFTEALGQWDTLRNIYPRYPGIDIEVSQLMKRRDQQAKEEAKARLIDQVDQLINQGEFTRALERLSVARSEEPQDPELAGLERLARQGRERALEAQSICSQAQSLYEQKNFPEAVDLLHRAQKLDPKNEAIQGVLVNALVEQARRLVDSEDWRGAEPLLQEASTLDTAHAGARALRTLIADNRRKEFVSQCLAEARDLQASGSVESALSKVESALAQYPKESRLLQQQTALQNLLQGERHRATRANDLGELKDLRKKIGDAPPASDLGSIFDPSIFERTQAIQKKYPDDPEVGTIAAEISHFAHPGLAAAASAAPANAAPAPPAEMLSTAGPANATVTAHPGPVPVANQTAPPAAQPPAPQPAPKPTAARARKSGPPLFKQRRFGMYAGVGAAVVVLLAAAVIVSSRKAHPTPAPRSTAAATIAVAIQTSPADATVTVNGEAHSGTVNLLSGRGYDVVVSRPGYVTDRESGKRASATWSYALEPEPVRLTFAASDKAGKILVDNMEKTDIQSGVPQDLELPPDGAPHTISVKGATSDVLQFTVTAKPAELPVISNLNPKDLIIVSSFGHDAVVYTGGRTLKGNLYGQPPQPITADGLRLTLADNVENFIAFDDKDVSKISLAVDNAPSIYIGLNAEKNIAYLTFQCTNVPWARLIVDGTERKPMKPGKWRLMGLPPGPHSILVEADGFESYSQQVQLTKGSTLPLNVELKQKVITTSKLVIENGTPGAQVFVDGAEKSTLDASGSAAIEVPAGEHRISFRKQDFENSPEITRTFIGGQQILLQGEAQLKKIVTVVAPPPPKPAPKPTPAPVVLKPLTISSLFANPSLIAQDGLWWKSSAETDYVFLRPGVILKFSLAFLDPGKNLFGKRRKVEWVLSYLNSQDKVSYDFDGKRLRRRATAKGEKAESDSTACEAHPGDLQFVIAIEPSKIVVTPDGCDAETYESTDRDLTMGQIGIKPNADFVIRRP
jgi:serine/threonine protein kinase